MTDIRIEVAIILLAKEKNRQLSGCGRAVSTTHEQSFVCSLRRMSPSLITAAASDYEVLKRHTFATEPANPGVYLKLLHGRETMDQEMDDWGADGPWIGPLDWFHCTYMADIGLGFSNGDELGPFGSNDNPPAPIFIGEGLLYFDGMYYGDWEIQRA